MHSKMFLNLFCVFFVIQSLTDYFNIKGFISSFPFDRRVMAQFNQIFGLSLLIFILVFIAIKRINIIPLIHNKFSFWLILFIYFTFINIWMLNPDTLFKIKNSIRFMQFFSLYFIVIFTVQNEEHIRKIAKTIIIIILLKVFIILAGKNIFSSGTLYTGQVVTYLPVFLILSLRKGKDNFKFKNLFKVSIPFLIFFPLFSGQRRALLALFTIIILLLFKFHISRKIIFTFSISSVLIYLLFIHLPTEVSMRYINTFDFLKNKKDIINFQSDEMYHVSSGRSVIWRVYWKQAVKRPFQGHGVNVVKSNFMNFESEWSRKYRGEPKPHNVFLKIFADLGLLGFIPFIFMVILPIKWLWAESFSSEEKDSGIFNDLSWAFLTVWIVYHVQAFLGHEGPYGKEWYMLYGFLVSIMLIKDKYEKQYSSNTKI